MMNTLRSEFIKLRTITTHWILAAIALVFPIVVVTLVSSLASFDDGLESIDIANLIVGITVVSAMLLGAMTAISLTSDYGHNTIRPTYAATPNRFRVIASKVIVNTSSVLVVTCTAVGVAWTAGLVVLSIRDSSISLTDDGVLSTLASVIVLGASVSLFGLGLGLIIRNSPATVTILLLWPLLIEPLLGLVVSLIGWNGVGKWLPYQAAISAATSESGGTDDLLGRPMGLVYFAAVAVALIVVGALLDERRDA